MWRDREHDVCGECSGGETGRPPSEPEDCPQGPDLIVDEDYLRSTKYLTRSWLKTNAGGRALRSWAWRTAASQVWHRIANIGNRDRLGQLSMIYRSGTGTSATAISTFLRMPNTTSLMYRMVRFCRSVPRVDSR